MPTNRYIVSHHASKVDEYENEKANWEKLGDPQVPWLPLLISSSAHPGTEIKAPKFKKKLADPLAAPPDPTPSTSMDPLRWDYGESSSPLSSEMIRSIQHFPTLCTRYSVYFEQNLNKVRGERPTSQRHFVSIQDWVLEYTNTLWESDASPDLLELLNPNPKEYAILATYYSVAPPSVVSQFGKLCIDMTLTHSMMSLGHVMEHGTHSDITKALIESGQDSSLLGNAEQSFAKIMAYREIKFRAVTQLLMHRTLNHIALVAGLELPCFGVDHNLVGAFISMDNPDVPMAELERHGVPLHGDLSSESQAVANGVAECGPNEAHGEFMEIWRMKQGAQVKHPSLWMI
ncbi:hypothetical protein BS47DRAFT_1363707 [Hydnum rufescens UP504]|uniref:Uncharacterized protein n=1 Tax=Hydnum rufescens UP504 TaxID=1448309 RepID=A0A9P6ATA9_9AGAM|nr:hypothetical protein BS47DRAFT_1363707 [Hydnum rufescens UP504]